MVGGGLEVKNPVWLDYNMDGAVDLFLAGAPITLLRNELQTHGTATFTRVTENDLDWGIRATLSIVT